MWCGIVGDKLIGPYIFLQHLTGDTLDFLQNELLAPLQNIPLQIQLQM
jgi:hypothetical protein